MDTSIIRLAVTAIGLVCCLCVGGVVIVSATGREPPANLGNIAATCAGALVGILVVPRWPPSGGASLSGTGPKTPERSPQALP